MATVHRWKHNTSGQIVDVAFPFPEKFTAAGKDWTKDTFIAEYTFQQADVAAELPKVDPKTIPTMAVTQTPGDPVGKPTAPPPAAPVDLGPLHAKLDELAGKVESLKGLHEQLDRVVQGLAMLPGELHRVGELVGAVHSVVVPPKG